MTCLSEGGKFLSASIGRINQENMKFQREEFFVIEEDLQFDTEAKKREFWDDWNNGAD